MKVSEWLTFINILHIPRIHYAHSLDPHSVVISLIRPYSRSVHNSLHKTLHKGRFLFNTIDREKSSLSHVSSWNFSAIEDSSTNSECNFYSGFENAIQMKVYPVLVRHVKHRQLTDISFTRDGELQMVWGCDKLGLIAFVEGTVNTVWIAILTKESVPFMDAGAGAWITDIIFQQDNASCHVSEKTKEWLQKMQDRSIVFYNNGKTSEFTRH